MSVEGEAADLSSTRWDTKYLLSHITLSGKLNHDPIFSVHQPHYEVVVLKIDGHVISLQL